MLFTWPTTAVFRKPDTRDMPKLTRSDPDALTLGYHERVCLRILLDHPDVMHAALRDPELNIAYQALRRIQLA